MLKIAVCITVTLTAVLESSLMREEAVRDRRLCIQRSLSVPGQAETPIRGRLPETLFRSNSTT
jgi:hypothetical protein